VLLGKEGLKELADQNLAKARFALEELEKVPACGARFPAIFQRIRRRVATFSEIGECRTPAEKIIGPLPWATSIRN